MNGGRASGGIGRRQFCASSLGAGLSPRGAGAEQRPNFMVIMADQHSPHAFGYRGDPVVETPHLDALARRGVSFESAYCQSPLCVPSRMSFMTGSEPSRIRIFSNDDTLPSDVPTFAHALVAGGYDTTLIGHMHFLGSDQLHGFGRQLGGAIVPMYPHIPYSMPPEMRAGAAGGSHAAIRVTGPGVTPVQAYDAESTRRTVEFLRTKAGGTSRPWCAVVGLVLPHPPYICRPEDWDYYLTRVTIPQTPPQYFQSLHPAIQRWRQSREIDDFTPEEIRRARAGYYGLIAQHDRQVGEILAELAKSGLDRETVVIYTSDHGEMAGELGMWWKSSFYDGSVGVPLIISFPGRFQPRRYTRQVVRLVDVAPTLTEMACAPTLPDASGRSLMPLLEGNSADWDEAAFSVSASGRGVPASRMVRWRNWKLVHFEGYRPQLFDLETDPHESNDLGETQAHGRMREHLHQLVLRDWSAADMEAEIARRAKRAPLLRQWALAAQPPAPQQWYPPAGSVAFPKR